MVLNAPFDFGADINTSDWDAGLYIWEIWRDNLRKAAGIMVNRFEPLPKRMACIYSVNKNNLIVR